MPCHTWRLLKETSKRADSCAAAGGKGEKRPVRPNRTARTRATLRGASGPPRQHDVGRVLDGIAEGGEEFQCRAHCAAVLQPAYGTRSQWSTKVPKTPLPVAVILLPSNTTAGSPCSGICICIRVPFIFTGDAPPADDKS